MLLAKFYLLSGMSNAEVTLSLERGFRHPRPRNCGTALYELMLSCWKEEPEERPTFEYLASLLDDFDEASKSQYMEGE